MNRCRMAKDMRGDAPWCAICPALLQMGGVATHEFINPIPRQRLPAVRGKHRTIRGVPDWQSVEESLQQRYRFLPEGTDPPFIAFAMEMYAGLGLQLQMGHP